MSSYIIQVFFIAFPLKNFWPWGSEIRSSVFPKETLYASLDTMQWHFYCYSVILFGHNICGLTQWVYSCSFWWIFLCGITKIPRCVQQYYSSDQYQSAQQHHHVRDPDNSAHQNQPDSDAHHSLTRHVATRQ